MNFYSRKFAVLVSGLLALLFCANQVKTAPLQVSSNPGAPQQSQDPKSKCISCNSDSALGSGAVPGVPRETCSVPNVHSLVLGAPEESTRPCEKKIAASTNLDVRTSGDFSNFLLAFSSLKFLSDKEQEAAVSGVAALSWSEAQIQPTLNWLSVPTGIVPETSPYTFTQHLNHRSISYDSETVSSPEFMPVDELSPGMKGTGRTVFSGNDIIDFEVEILGVLKDIYPDGDLILVKLQHELLDKTGLIAGMSGSPVYVDGKLIGAIAYGWGFTKETIAGVTPIMEMISLFDRGEGETKPVAWHERAFTYEMRDPISVGGYDYKEVVVNTQDKPFDEHSSISIVLNPIATPVTVSGFSREVFEKIDPFFRKFSLVPIQSGGAKEKKKSKHLFPGSVVGAQLLSGDSELTAFGTATWVNGGRVLAFGHPFLGRGKVEFPMVSGSVLTIIPSQAFSFKLSSSGSTLGKFTRDVRPAIGGEIGKDAELITSRILIKTATSKKRFNYDMIHDELFTPQLLSWSLLNSISSLGVSPEKTTILKMKINLKDSKKPFVYENVFGKSSSGSFSGNLMWEFELPMLMRNLMANQFQDVRIKNVDVEMDLHEETLASSIESVRVGRKKLEPGDELNLSIVLKSYGNEYTTIYRKIRIPESLPDGELTLIVCDARESSRLNTTFYPQKNIPHSLEQLYDILTEGEKNNEIMIRLFLPRAGVIVLGKELPSLPGSIFSIMGSSTETGVESFIAEVHDRIKTEWLISGKHEIKIMVEGK